MPAYRTRQHTRASASISARQRAARFFKLIDIGEGMRGNSFIDINKIKSSSRVHSWHWNTEDKSHQCLVSADNLEVCFHPECSDSTAAIRGSQPLVRNGNYYFWEIHVEDKIYGTSVMFGLCTKEQKLHSLDYCNLIGLDEHGWSLSHKGVLYHCGDFVQFSTMFPQNQPVTIGVLFDTLRGQLSYFVNGKYLGVAFSGLNDVKGELYPAVGSTAKCTRMRLTGAYSGYELSASLLERSCFTLLKSARDKNKLLDHLYECKVPNTLINYLVEVCDSQTKITVEIDQNGYLINHLKDTS